MKPTVEVHDRRDLIKQQAQLKRRVQRLQQTRVRLLNRGGKGWVLEISTTNMELQRAFDQLTHILGRLR